MEAFTADQIGWAFRKRFERLKGRRAEIALKDKIIMGTCFSDNIIRDYVIDRSVAGTFVAMAEYGQLGFTELDKKESALRVVMGAGKEPDEATVGHMIENEERYGSSDFTVIFVGRDGRPKKLAEKEGDGLAKGGV